MITLRPVPKPSSQAKPARRPIRKSRVKPVNAKRKAKELLRTFGPPERREWMKLMPCVADCCPHKTENVHTKGGGGSRRADARFIVPMCRFHHRYLHDHGEAGLRRMFMPTALPLVEIAANYELLWQEQLSSRSSESRLRSRRNLLPDPR